MACARCPYTANYELLWRDPHEPDVLCVLLRCCAGPELQIRRGSDVLSSEIFTTVSAARERAEELRPGAGASNAILSSEWTLEVGQH